MGFTRDGHVFVNHPREPWTGLEPDIQIHARVSTLRGKPNTPERARYAAAKLSFSLAAAEEIVVRSMSEVVLEKIVDCVVSAGVHCRIIMPHPSFDDDDGDRLLSAGQHVRNALPIAYANFLSRLLGGVVDEEIIQIARVGRTNLTRWPRYLYQPIFGGVVRQDHPYLIADDVVSTAGTMAALRSYIVRNGGRVVCATAMANFEGANQAFCPTEQIVNELQATFGPELNMLWTETIGHDIGCLTNAEANHLAEWSHEQLQSPGRRADQRELLHRLRSQLDKAAAKEG
jgi:hypothetical protein